LEGLQTGRQPFHMTFVTADQKEDAWNVPVGVLDILPTLTSRHGGFAEKRKPTFNNL
jgi:hypothetical protein